MGVPKGRNRREERSGRFQASPKSSNINSIRFTLEIYFFFFSLLPSFLIPLRKQFGIPWLCQVEVPLLKTLGSPGSNASHGDPTHDNWQDTFLEPEVMSHSETVRAVRC